MRRGLVSGKFMPLHRGHELLIDTALAECDDVTVVVYDTHVKEGPPMPLEKRLGWVRKLYPNIEQIVGVPDLYEAMPGHDGADYGYLYADRLQFLGRFDRYYSSEPMYGEFAKHLRGAPEHVVVDEARKLVDISGSRIRQDPYAYRGLMHPDIYASLVQKVVFVGTESTGKSTLAKACAEKYGTRWVHEFGRELWESQDLQGTFADHWKMAQRQRQRELHGARHADGFLFCDTNAWTTLQWSLMAYGVADPRLEALVAETLDDYIWLLCEDDFGWVDDDVRELRGDRAHAFQAQQVLDLERRGVAFRRLRGPVERRLLEVEDILGPAHVTAT